MDWNQVPSKYLATANQVKAILKAQAQLPNDVIEQEVFNFFTQTNMQSFWDSPPDKIAQGVVTYYSAKSKKPESEPNENIQYIMWLYPSSEASLNANLEAKLKALPLVKYYASHSIQDAFNTLSLVPLQYWRVILPGPYAKEFIAKVPDEMRNRRFVCKLMLFSRQLAGLEWARNEQYLAFGGVSNKEEDVLKFCSGDSMMATWKSMFQLTFPKDKAKALASSFDKVTVNLKSRAVFFNGTNIVSPTPTSYTVSDTGRNNRFMDVVEPSFVYDMKKELPLDVMEALICSKDVPGFDTNTKILMGLIAHATLEDRDINERNKLVKWIIPCDGWYPNVILGMFLIRAYTAETFLYKDLNMALAMKNIPIIGRFRDYIKVIMRVYTFKKLPYFTGVLYRGINTNDTQIARYKPGVSICFSSFVSASKNVNFVLKNKPNTIFEIHTCSSDYQEKNTFGYTNADLHKTGISVFPTEEEVLYLPLSTFYIKSVSKKEGRNYIVLEEATGSIYHMQVAQIQQNVDQGNDPCKVM